MSKTLQFIYILNLVNRDKIENPDDEFNSIMSEHFTYLQNLLIEDILILAGPCLDAAFGVAILKAETIDDAIIIMNDDPAITRGAMTAEIHPFRISLMASNDSETI